MAAYVKITNFAVKDGLLSGNPSKIVSGSEIDAELNAIALSSSQNLTAITDAQTATASSASAAATSASNASTSATNASNSATTATTQAGIATTNANNTAAIVADPGWIAVAADLVGADTIGAVATIAANVTTVAGISANVTTVAGISSNVTTVATAITNVNAVGADLLEPTSEINTVATDIANVNTVGTAIANVNAVGLAIANVNTVAGISANVTTVAGISANVTTVAGISANVTSVAGNATNINLVAADATDIGTVATANAAIGTVSTNIASVNTVSGISGNVTTVAGISGNVTTVAGVAASVPTVAGIAANVTTVAGVSASVTTVAGISANVTTVAGNTANINAVAGVSADVSAVAAQFIGWNFSTTTTMADPGSGIMRLNNATLASVTAIAFDDNNSAAADVSAYVLTWDDSSSTVKGTITIRQGTANFAVFNVTGLTDNVGWTQVAVTHVSSSGTFADATLTFVDFDRSGDAGSGDASTTNPLSQFAATTSAQLAGVISDETGSGALVFATSPTLVTPALGTPASGTLTNCTFPTLNQDTTGTAAIANGLKSATTTVSVSAATAPTTGQVLTATAGTTATWQTPAAGASYTKTISGKTGAYTVVAGDLGAIINCTANSFTVSLTAAATLGSGFNCWVWNTSNTATHVITIDPNAAETIDGLTTLTLRRGEGVQIVCDGTNWQTGDKKMMRGYVENIPSGTARQVASGSGSIIVGTSGNGCTGANGMVVGYAADCSGIEAWAGGSRSNAQSNYSVALGESSAQTGATTATGAGAMALGGSYASGADSFAAAIANNTSSYGATGANSVAIGQTCKASAANSSAVGGLTNLASGISSTVNGGSTNTASGLYSTICGGFNALSSITGKWAYASGFHAAKGDAQTGMIVLRKATTDATPIAVTSDAGAAAATNQVILPNDSTYSFTILVVARRTDADNESAGYEFKGVVDRNANAASTALVGTVSKTVLAEDTVAWDCNVTADTTNGGLSVTVTGEAAKTIRWVATCWTSEVSG